MKICYINPTNNIRRPIAELAAILTHEGHQASIMYPLSKNCPTKNWIANEIVEKQQINKRPVDSWYSASLRYSFPNFFRLWKETRAVFHHHELIHIWEYYYPVSIFPLLYALFTGQRKKIILTTDGFVGYSYQPEKPTWMVLAFRLYTQLFARWLLKIPRVITTYGNAMLPYAQQVGVPKHKLRVLPTGIHLQRFANVSERKRVKIKEEFMITNEKVILYAGMLTERKGIPKVISTSVQLLDEGMNIKTLLVGDAHGENIYRKLVPVGYRKNIIFTGGRKEIPELMKIAQVLLLPSEGEGLPGVVMEAMAAGLPVVATDEGCTPDLIENGKEGILVSDGTYAEAVKKLLQDQDFHKRCSHAAQQKIKDFSWEHISKKYLALYHEEER